MVQLQFLNKLLDSRDIGLLLENSDLNEDFFSDYINEFKFIREHIDKYGCMPDKETFLCHFPDFDVLSVHDSIDYLINELYNDRNKRELAKTFNKIRDRINVGDIAGAMSIFETSKDLTVSAHHINSVDLLNDTSRYSAYVERCDDFGKFFVSTGLKELDKVIGGWDRKEEYATIIARSGTGKTWILLKSAVAALEQGLRVGIYSGEMTDMKVGYRIDTLISHISNTCITKGNAIVQNDYKKYIDSLSDRYKGCLKVLTPKELGRSATVNDLRAFIRNDKLDILFVDQHSFLEDIRKGKNRTDRASNISSDLKNLQVLEQVPLITVCQQNRESTENGVDVSHISQDRKSVV